MARRKSQDLRRTYRFTGLLLENWRNFVDADVNLQPRTFLVGPNASGKSNFLDVFSLSLRHSSRRGRVPGSGQEARRGFRASRAGRQTILGHRAPSDGRERRTQATGGRCRVSTSHPGVRGRGGRGGPREESNRHRGPLVHFSYEALADRPRLRQGGGRFRLGAGRLGPPTPADPRERKSASRTARCGGVRRAVGPRWGERMPRRQGPGAGPGHGGDQVGFLLTVTTTRAAGGETRPCSQTPVTSWRADN